MATMEGVEAPGSLVAAMDGAELATSNGDGQRGCCSVSSFGGRGLEDGESKNLYKLLPRPSNWEPKNRDEELGSWRDWTWGLEQYTFPVLTPSMVMR